MCLAIPARILTLHAPARAMVDIGGVHKEIDVSLLPGLQVDDYVIVHTGYALSRIDTDEAQKTLGLFAELEALAAHAEGR